MKHHLLACNMFDWLKLAIKSNIKKYKEYKCDVNEFEQLKIIANLYSLIKKIKNID